MPWAPRSSIAGLEGSGELALRGLLEQQGADLGEGLVGDLGGPLEPVDLAVVLDRPQAEQEADGRDQRAGQILGPALLGVPGDVIGLEPDPVDAAQDVGEASRRSRG